MRWDKLLNAFLSVCMVLVILGILIFLLPGLSSTPATPTSPTTTDGTPASSLPPETISRQETVLPVPDLTVTAGRTFACTAEEFILYCNQLYHSDINADWLSPLENWIRYPEEAAPCTGVSGDRYSFDPDPAIHNEPTISLHIHNGCISQVTLTLAEHDWTQWRQDMFLAQCRYTLRAFFPTLTALEIDALAVMLYTGATEARHSAEDCTVWYEGTAGCCAYCQNGIIFVCVIPVPEGTMDARYVPMADMSH